MNYIQRSFLLFCITTFFFLLTSCTKDIKKIKLKPDSSVFEITEDDENNDILNIIASIPILDLKRISTKKGKFILIESQNLYKIFGKGMPNIPVYSNLIEVPLDTKVEGTIINCDEEIIDLKEYNIYDKIIPAQPSLSKSDDPEKAPFYYDSLAYIKDEYFYTKTIVFEDLGIMRSIRLFRVEIRPIQYNPVKNILKVLNNLKIEIKFKDADHSKTEKFKSKYSSPLFDSVFENIISNFRTNDKLFTKRKGITYVIVSDKMFKATLQPFISLKRSLGFDVIEAYTDQPNVGSTTKSIKKYLKNLYDNPPAGMSPHQYLLLVGDYAQIPSHEENIIILFSDQYFAEYTGDYLPDVYYGRFSANTVAQLKPQIDKTLEYELYKFPYPYYIFHTVFIVGADEKNKAITYSNPQFKYLTANYFNATYGITTHTYFQPEPKKDDYSASIKTDINSGAGLVIYSGHGTAHKWIDPEFTSSDIYNLSSSYQYGLWLGQCCRSNNFYISECFGEAALRVKNRGAVGYIALNNRSFFEEDFWWSVGFKKVSANPKYDKKHLGAFDRLFHSHGEPPSEWHSTFGQLIVGGNLAIEQSTSTLKEYYWKCSHLLGDPSLEIKTKSINFPKLINICNLYPEICYPLYYIPPYWIVFKFPVRDDYIFIAPFELFYQLLKENPENNVTDGNDCYYHIIFENFDLNKWDVNLFTPEGELATYRLYNTKESSVISFRPAKVFSKLALTGNYVLVFKPRTKYEGELKIKTILKMADSPYMNEK